MKFPIVTKSEFDQLSDKMKNVYRTHPDFLKVKYSDPNFPTLYINETGDWIDLKCADNYFLKKGESALINLGVAMKLPEKTEAHLVPRSSTFKKYGLIQTNGVGIIDNSYSGNNDIWMMPVYALDRDIEINKGDRLCQFRLFPAMEEMFNTHWGYRKFLITEVDFLDSIDRGGFGSTDK